MSIIAELKRSNTYNAIKTKFYNILQNSYSFISWVLDFSLIMAGAVCLIIIQSYPFQSDTLQKDILPGHEVLLMFFGFIGAMMISDAAADKLGFTGYKHTILKTVVACLTLYMTALAYTYEIPESYLVTISSICSYYLFVNPVWNFVNNIKAIAQKRYSKTDTILVIEDTRSPILDDIIQIINERYNIKLVVSLKGTKTILKKKHVYSLQSLESTLLSLRYIVFGNTIKQLIYVTDAPSKDRVKTLISLCAKYNFRLFKTPYLSNITKFVQNKINIMPISLNDVFGAYFLSDDNRQFFLQYCRDKNIWITYSGENLIRGLILAVAETGVKFTNIFASTEKHAQEVDLLLQDFPSLPYSIKISNITQAIKFSNNDKADVVFYTMPFNNPLLEYDNTCSIFEQNTLNTISLIDTCLAKRVQLFILSDTEATMYKNWIGVTQRLTEIYSKAPENKEFCNIVRVPFSRQTDNRLLKEFMYSLNFRNSINLRYRAPSLSLETHVLDTLISAISYALNEKDRVFIIKDAPGPNPKEVYKLFLNFYGLRLYEDMGVPYSILDRLDTDAFETPNVKIFKTPIGNLYSEKVLVTANKNSIKTLLEPSKDFIRQNNMSEITQLGIYVLKQIYNQYNDSGRLERRLV